MLRNVKTFVSWSVVLGHRIMNLLSVLLLLVLETEALPLLRERLMEGEFEYFYNLELVDKLQLLDHNRTDITEEDVERIVNHDAHDPKMDEILDKMLEQGEMIEEVLREIEDVSRIHDLTEDFQPDFASSLLYQMLYWALLVLSGLTLTASLLVTTKYIIDNPKSFTTHHVKSDLEFQFYPGRPRT